MSQGSDIRRNPGQVRINDDMLSQIIATSTDIAKRQEEKLGLSDNDNELITEERDNPNTTVKQIMQVITSIENEIAQIKGLLRRLK